MSTERNRRKAAARKLRHARRARMAERDRTGCEQPQKPAYDIADEWERQRAEHMGGPTRQLYLCRCGWWHHTTAPHPTPNGRA